MSEWQQINSRVQPRSDLAMDQFVRADSKYPPHHAAYSSQNQEVKVSALDEFFPRDEDQDQDQEPGTPAPIPQGKAREMILAGNAVITVLNTETGNRFTYKIQKPDAEKPWFVRVRCGGSDEDRWEFLGTIFQNLSYRHGKRSSITQGAQSAKVFQWLWTSLDILPPSIEIWHEGSCCRCGRQLTDPESIQRGLGPVCAGLLS